MISWSKDFYAGVTCDSYSFRFFFQTDTLWMGDSPEFHRADLVVTPDSAEWAILLKLIFTVVEQWEWKWNELWNLQYFPQRKPFSSCYMQRVVWLSLLFLIPSREFPCYVFPSALSMRGGWMVCSGKVREKVTNVWRLRWNWNEAAGENIGDPAASWEMGNHGDSRGSCGQRVWQSGHNSGLIHHMGIMLLTGTTTEKSYTRSRPATESINSPLPHRRSQCLLEKRQAKWTRIIELKVKKTPQHLS